MKRYWNLRNQLSHPFLIVGDVNAHNRWRGCSNESNYGKLVDEGLILLNDIHTRFNISNESSSAIDLSFSSLSIAADLK